MLEAEAERYVNGEVVSHHVVDRTRDLAVGIDVNLGVGQAGRRQVAAVDRGGDGREADGCGKRACLLGQGRAAESQRSRSQQVGENFFHEYARGLNRLQPAGHGEVFTDQLGQQLVAIHRWMEAVGKAVGFPPVGAA